MALVRLLIATMTLVGFGIMGLAVSMSEAEEEFEIQFSDRFRESVERDIAATPTLGERNTDHLLREDLRETENQLAAIRHIGRPEIFDPHGHERRAAMPHADMISYELWKDSFLMRHGRELSPDFLQAEVPHRDYLGLLQGISRDGFVNSSGNETALDDGQVHRSIPLLGVVGGVGAVGIKGLAVAIPAKLRPLLAGGAFGTATGYGLSKVFDTDYGWRNAIIDFGVGAATGPAVVALGRTFFKLARIPKATKIPDDVVYEPLPEWLLGETSRAGDITINSSLKGTRKALETYQHELVHQALTPSPGSLFATQRQDLMMWGYHNSHFLKWFEESLAEGIAQKGLIKGVTFPIKNGYAITKSRAVVEGIGVITYFGGAVSSGDYFADKLYED